MRKILCLLTALLSLTAAHAESHVESTDNFEGKVVIVKAVIYADTTSTGWQTNESNKTVVYLYNGENYLIPYVDATKADSAFAADPYRFYWVISKAPSTADSQYYYLSALKGDHYVGITAGQNLVTGNWTGATVTSTDNYQAEFPYLGFDKSGTYGATNAYTVQGISLRFNFGTQGVRWLAVSEQGLVNWLQNTTNCQTINNVKWTTNLELVEVTATETIGDHGTLAAPKHYGYKVTLTRSDDGCAENEGEDYNYYATLKLPYAVELPSDVTAYSLSKKSNVTNDVVGLTKMSLSTTNSLGGTEKNILPRESPVILTMTHTEGDADVQKTIYLQPEKAQTFASTGLGGTLAKKTYADSVYAGATDTLTYYILTKRGGRVAFRPMGNKTLAANKAFYEWRPSDASTGAKPDALSFVFLTDEDDQEATAISRPDAAATDEAAPCYDLTGRLVGQPTQPGLYIRQGRKVVIR